MEQIKEFLDRIQKMADNEKEHLEWLESVKADPKIIEKSRKWYDYYIKRLGEYKEYFEKLKR